MVQSMCRSIRILANFEPPATSTEVQAAARQYVRKVSGTTSQANEQAIQQAVDAVADATAELLDTLVFSSPPRDREVEAAKGRERNERRFSASRSTAPG